MDNPISKLIAGFKELGFLELSNSEVVGRVPREGEIEGTYIEVQINLADYPLKSPSIFLVKINGRSNLYREIPTNWNHLDEFMIGKNVKESKYLICSLHNWIPREDYDATFFYERIYDWLEFNIYNKWDETNEVLGWRLTPNLTPSKIYLTKALSREIKPKEVRSMSVEHTQLIFKSKSKASTKNEATNYELNNIDFSYNYSFFPKYESDYKIAHTKELKLSMNKKLHSTKFLVIRLPQHYSFTTFYQLLVKVRDNFKNKLKTFIDGKLNIPILIFFKGKLDNFEAVSFFVDNKFVDGEDNFDVYPLSIETIPDRPISIPLKVGLIGLGSLGSQIARVLADKQTEEIIVYDKEVLSADNLGHHELDARFLGFNKADAMSLYLNSFRINTNVSLGENVSDVYKKSDILVVTVGNSEEYYKLAFDELSSFNGYIIWAWVSPYNILQEIVITNLNSGCMNCYFIKEQEDPELKSFNNVLESELKKFPSYTYDFCGQPHTNSQWEKNVFLATQIVSIINDYTNRKRVKFNYYAFLWRKEDITPSSTMGTLEKNENCFCIGGRS